MAWVVSASVTSTFASHGLSGLGTLHAWETFGDDIAPDLQAVAKGLGGGSGQVSLSQYNLL